MSIDATLARTMQNILVRESRSLLQYVSESYPWTTPQGEQALSHVQKLVKQELDGCISLARYLKKHRIPLPYLGSYPMSFTTINFVSLAHLLPMLAEYMSNMSVDLERDLANMHDAEARAIVEKIMATKKHHRETLTQLAATATAIAAA